VRFKKGDTVAYGIVEGSQVRRLGGDLFGDWYKTDTLYPLDAVTLLVPSTPSKVIALAGNYRDHLGDTPVPPDPEGFFKVPSCLQRQEGDIVIPEGAEDVHYEAELVIVIGRRAKHVTKEAALDHVLGVTCGCDVSERIWQANDRQWWRAKGSDTFGPCGPWITAGLDYGRLDMELRLNGKVRQKTNTKDMIHDIPTVVSFLSRYVTLEPGDLIFTGTAGTTQPIKPGDVVEVEIQGVGVLRNPVVAEK
jgi:2-keto-4-pentenoate hydratase/2-oxohepta-3-ene-1,7-dioic acid hydratase in catechol pathway